MTISRWEVPPDTVVTPDNGGGAYKPPSGGSGGSGGSSGISTGGGAGIVVANPVEQPPPDRPAVPNFGWNSGAHSIEVKPANWVGRVEFDIPDVQGSRPGGVAIGLALVSALPATHRDGYDHLRYGLVFTATVVKVIHAAQVVLTVPYEDVRALRTPGGATDVVNGLLYGDFIKWVVNEQAIYAGSFEMLGNFALDATLYTAYDAVDNPAFVSGNWDTSHPGLEDGSLNGVTPRFLMEGAMTGETSLLVNLPRLSTRLSETAYGDIKVVLHEFTMTSGYSDTLEAALPSLSFRAYETSTFGEILGSLQPYNMAATLREPDGDVVYSVLVPALQRLRMTGAFEATAQFDAVLPTLYMRMSAEMTYSELVAGILPLRVLAYGGEQTPLVQIVDGIGAWSPAITSWRVYLAAVERVGGGVTFLLQIVSAVDATEHITTEDAWSAMQTVFVDVLDQVGLIDRVRVLGFDAAGAIDDGEAWVVNTPNNATTRYDSYGFNSFARVGGKHFGMKPDGVYLLEGATDAGRAIQSGVAFGKHTFGTQALKHIKAVYVGVSSGDELFLKVSDGTREFTYKARRHDPHMRMQRFDVGGGLRAGYYTFELTTDKDAMELDSITFHVIATERRI